VKVTFGGQPPRCRRAPRGSHRSRGSAPRESLRSREHGGERLVGDEVPTKATSDRGRGRRRTPRATGGRVRITMALPPQLRDVRPPIVVTTFVAARDHTLDRRDDAPRSREKRRCGGRGRSAPVIRQAATEPQKRRVLRARAPGGAGTAARRCGRSGPRSCRRSSLARAGARRRSAAASSSANIRLRRLYGAQAIARPCGRALMPGPRRDSRRSGHISATVPGVDLDVEVPGHDRGRNGPVGPRRRLTERAAASASAGSSPGATQPVDPVVDQLPHRRQVRGHHGRPVAIASGTTFGMPST
jgi:hypothetical protein